MLRRKVESFLLPNRVAGLEVTLQQDGSYIFHFVVLQYAKEVVSILKKGTASKIDELIQQLTSDVPLVLVLNGKGIVHKHVLKEAVAKYGSSAEMIASAFPTLKVLDFYVQQYLSENGSFFSLTRQDTADKLLNLLIKKGYQVLATSLGPFIFTSVWPFLKQKDEVSTSFTLGEHFITLGEYGVIHRTSSVSVQPSEGILIGEDRLPEEMVLAYASALNELTNTAPFLNLTIGSVSKSREEFKHRAIFKMASLTALAFFFIVLLSNFLLFSSLSEEQSFLERQLQGQSNKLEEMKRLESEVKEKGSFLIKAGWLTTPKISFYADRLGASVPAGIQLTTISVNPYDEQKSKAEGKEIFELNTIAVKGICKNPLLLNGWIKKMNKFGWIQQIDNQNYSFEESKQEGTFDFKIRLKNK